MAFAGAVTEIGIAIAGAEFHSSDLRPKKVRFVGYLRRRSGRAGAENSTRDECARWNPVSHQTDFQKWLREQVIFCAVRFPGRFSKLRPENFTPRRPGVKRFSCPGRA